MSENNKKEYKYNFVFSDTTSKSVSKTIGVDEEFISNTNDKFSAIMLDLVKNVVNKSPGAEYLENLKSSTRNSTPIHAMLALKEYAKAARDNQGNTESLKQSDLLQILVKNFEPEEMALILMATIKKTLVEAATFQGTKELLEVLKESNLDFRSLENFKEFLDLTVHVKEMDSSSSFMASGVFTSIMVYYLNK